MSLFHFFKIKKRNFNIFSSRKMVRQKSRKTVEDLYSAPPLQAPLATTRFDETFFQNSKNMKCNKMPEKHEFSNLNTTTACRKKGKGLNANAVVATEKKDEKTFINEERLHGKTIKSKKPEPFTAANLDNKNVISFVEETEKDEDTEEFFELIKETVENAVGKTLSDILNRNFREVSAKIDDLREQLRANEVKLEKIQADMNNTNKALTVLPEIVHYGEENSRHFRYLCMKSEYDKMFYQHQNIMAGIPVEARPNVINPYPQQYAPPGVPQQGQQIPQQSMHVQQQPPMQQTQPTSSQAQPMQQPPHQQMSMPIPPPPSQQSQQSQQSQLSTQSSKNVASTSHCNCHNQGGCGDFDCAKRSKSSVSSKSSDIGIKDVKDLLEQLQRYYEHQQAHQKEGKKEPREITLNIEDDSGDDDEDESSDELSTPSIEEKLDAGGGDS